MNAETFSPCLLCGEPAAEKDREACAQCSPRTCHACEQVATRAYNGGAGGLTFACLHHAQTSDVELSEWVALRAT